MRLNLLPSWLGRRKTVLLVTVVGALVIASELGFLTELRASAVTRQETLLRERAAGQASLALLNSIAAEASSSLASGREVETKLGFIHGVMSFNRNSVRLYEGTARHVDREATLLHANLTTGSLEMRAYVSERAEVAQLMLGLSQSPDFEGLPHVSGVPAFGPQRAREDEAAAVPAPNVIGGLMIGSLSANGTSVRNAPTGRSAPGASEGSEVPSSRAGEESTGDDLAPLELSGARRRPRGFVVRVACRLKAPRIRPNFGDSEAQLGESRGSNQPGVGLP